MGLDLTGLGQVAASAEGILRMFFPDKSQEERDRIASALALLQSQADINKVEAGNPSPFVAGWRPFVGWVCGASLGLMYIPKAIVMTVIWTKMAWAAAAAGALLPAYPDLGVGDLLGLLMSLLGLAGLRTFEKKTGVA